MKANFCISFSMLLLSFFFFNDAEAQNLRGDTIYVDANSEVSVRFPSLIDSFTFQDKDQIGLYKVTSIDNRSISIRALKNGVEDKALKVNEGGNKHIFILSCKDGSPAQPINYSTKKRLKDRAKITMKNLSKALNEADSLYEQAKKGVSEQAAWKKALSKYQSVELLVEDSKDAGVVKSRLDEIHTHIQSINGKNFEEAIKEGDQYHLSKNYVEARKSYLKAQQFNPGNLQVLKAININDSLWAKDYVDKGEDAYRKKDFVLAKTYYSNAYKIKPDYPFQQNKVDLIIKEANKVILKIEKEKLDQAFKANDIQEARIAYDSALAVSPNNSYIKSQLYKLINEEKKMEVEKKEQAAYLDALAAAKRLEDKASSVEEYDSAIREYKRASSIIPTRIFPKKKVDELTKRKNGVRAN